MSPSVSLMVTRPRERRYTLRRRFGFVRRYALRVARQTLERRVGAISDRVSDSFTTHGGLNNKLRKCMHLIHVKQSLARCVIWGTSFANKSAGGAPGTSFAGFAGCGSWSRFGGLFGRLLSVATPACCSSGWCSSHARPGRQARCSKGNCARLDAAASTHAPRRIPSPFHHHRLRAQRPARIRATRPRCVAPCRRDPRPVRRRIPWAPNALLRAPRAPNRSTAIP
jgi:hypothetical protein